MNDDLYRYIADYILYELFELKKTRADINADIIAAAIEAYNGGAR